MIFFLDQYNILSIGAKELYIYNTTLVITRTIKDIDKYSLSITIFYSLQTLNYLYFNKSYVPWSLSLRMLLQGEGD